MKYVVVLEVEPIWHGDTAQDVWHTVREEVVDYNMDGRMSDVRIISVKPHRDDEGCD